MGGGSKAAFLDRDGVINADKGYVHRWEDFEFLPGAVEAMRRLSEAGYALVVATNQSGIARGYFTERDYAALTETYTAWLRDRGIALLGVYHCPHHPAGTVDRFAVECTCRKPAPGMLVRAAQEHGIDLARSILIGDKIADVEAGRAAGMGAAYLVQSAQTGADAGEVPPDGTFESLAACVDHVTGVKTVRAR